MNISENKNDKIKIYFGIIVVAAVLALAILAYSQSSYDTSDFNGINGDFAIVAVESDSNGINGDGGFLVFVNDNEATSASALERDISISPAIPFTVMPNGDGFFLSLEENMKPGQVYTFSCGDYTVLFKERENLKIAEISPKSISGVALDEQLKITFNQQVTDDFASAVSIEPEVSGTWSSSGNTLVFSPQRLEGGTLYTVTVADGEIDNTDYELKKSTVFSFETQATSARVPCSSAFIPVSRGTTSFSGENLSIPVGNYIDEKITAELWYTDNNDLMVATAKPLFDVASWAEITRATWQGNTYNWKNIGKYEVETENTGDREITIKGSFADGYYLCRLTCGEVSFDTFVTVAPFDYDVIKQGKTCKIWAHDSKGKPVSHLKVAIGKNKSVADKNGVAELPYNSNQATFTLDGKKYVAFIDDITETAYYGDIFGDKVAVAADKIKCRGYVYGPVVDLDTVDIVLANGNCDLGSVKADVDENGFFEATWKGQPLPAGDYVLMAKSGEKTIASRIMTIGNVDSDKLTVTVKRSKKIVADKSKEVFTVKACYSNGTPVVNGEVSCESLGETVYRTNEYGEAKITKQISKITTDEAEKRHFDFTVQADTGAVGVGSTQITVVDQGTVLALKGSRKPNGSAEIKVRLYEYADKDKLAKVPLSGSVKVSFYIAPKGKKLSGNVDDMVLSESVFCDVEEKTFKLTKKLTADVDYLIVATLEGTDVTKSMFLYSNEKDVKVTDKTFLSADENFSWLYENSGYSLKFTPKNLTCKVEKVAVRGDSVKVAVSANRRGKTLFCGYLVKNSEVNRETAAASAIASAYYFGTGKGTLDIDCGGIYGDYTLVVTAYDGKGNSGSASHKVSLKDKDPVTFVGENVYFADDAVRLTFFAENSLKDSKYEFVLKKGNKIVDTQMGLITAQNVISLGKGLSGDYTGILKVYGDNSYTLDYDFTVKPKKASPALEVKPAYDENAVISYSVYRSDLVLYEDLFSIAAIPGYELLQILSKRNLSHLNIDTVDICDGGDLPLSYFQNSNGGFALIYEDKSDLLVSALVAKTNYDDYNKTALKGYIYNRIEKEDDRNTLSLCYWGLASLGEDVLQDINSLYSYKDLTLVETLYLAEGYAALGDKAKATSLYENLTKQLIFDENKAYLPADNKKTSVLYTLLYLDLTLSLDKDEYDGVLNYLSAASMNTLTNRYLYSLALTSLLKDSPAVKAENKETAKGRAIISLVESKEFAPGAIGVTYDRDNDALVSGAVAIADLYWDGSDDNIYLVAVKKSPSIVILNSDFHYCRNGMAMAIVSGDEFSMTLGLIGGKNGGTVYVWNLTSGKQVGSTNLNFAIKGEANNQ